MSPYALELIDASRSFNGRPAVKSLSMAAPQGEIIGFLGPNGAGKSTSLRMALGVISPDSGEARLFGQPPCLKSLFRVGFLPEERGLYRRMTARDVIAYFARLKGMKRKDAVARADALLESQGLGAHGAKRISRLSKGMAQKVQILATLAHTPDLIILDEPFSGLDPVNQQGLEDLIIAEHRRGATIVFSTHVMEHAERLCDRLVIIGEGEKRFDGALSEALALIPERAILSLDSGYDLSPTLAPLGLTATQDPTPEGATDWTITLSETCSAGDILRAAINAGAPIRAFSPRQAKLRDVFVKLTGSAPEPDIAPLPEEA